jgi:LysM repeat protein
MSPEKSSSPTQLCPTCGTRISIDATRCLVCGTELGKGVKTAKSTKAIQGSRLPEITLSLPVAIGLLAIFLGVGAIVVYFAVGRAAVPQVVVTETPTITPTTLPSLTPTPETPTPTFTPLPTLTPLAYTVKLGDTCGSIAFSFQVTIQSIVLQNNLPADCSTLIEGQILNIPQPTPTATALPTATLNPAEATKQACPLDFYTVKENDTLSGISLNYNVPMAEIRDWNGLVNDVVRFGQQLEIPLCKRNAPPGPTPTPTLPPPYPAVNLLLPADGAVFAQIDEVITLQWASVGTLRENESYAVTVEDLTEGQGRKLVEYVTDTKFIVPASFRANDSVPHIYRWWVVAVRQAGTDEDGNPVWEPAGAISAARVFTWLSLVSTGTQTP